MSDTVTRCANCQRRTRKERPSGFCWECDQLRETTLAQADLGPYAEKVAQFRLQGLAAEIRISAKRPMCPQCVAGSDADWAAILACLSDEWRLPTDFIESFTEHKLKTYRRGHLPDTDWKGGVVRTVRIKFAGEDSVISWRRNCRIRHVTGDLTSPLFGRVLIMDEDEDGRRTVKAVLSPRHPMLVDPWPSDDDA